MARRKKGIGRLPFVFLAIAVIAVTALAFTLSSNFQQTVQEAYSFYNEQRIFGMTLVPNVNILCTIQSETDILDVFGNRFLLTSKAPTVVDVFTNFQVTGLTTTSSEIRLLDPKAEVKCDPQEVDVSINLVGGWVQTKHEVQDQNGNFVEISRITKQIPEIPRSIKSNLVEIPTDTVTAQEIEDTANLMGVLSKNVQVKTTISANLEITTSATRTTLNTGGKVISSAGYVKIIVDQPPPTTSQGILVDITRVSPAGGYCFLGTTEIGCGSTSQSQIDFTGGTMTMTVVGEMDNWTVSEGLPFLRIFDPRGQQVGSDIVMTSTPRDLGNGHHEFKRINFDIARTITKSNIDTNKGTWILEMHSNNDVRKSSTGQTIIDRKTFILQDLSPLVPEPEPTCQSGQIIVDGMCQDPTGTEPPQTEQCPTTAELDELSQSVDDQSLLLGIQTFQNKSTLNTCEQAQLDSFLREAESRGLDTSQVTPEAGTQGAVAKIRLVGNYEPAGAESNEGCQDIRTVPEQGVPIQAFQLIGGGGSPCDNFRFGNIEIRPIIDFGQPLAESGIQIDKGSVRLSHTLFMSVNNQYPANPEINCEITSAQIPQTCEIVNHDFTNDPRVFFGSEEVITIAEPTDRETSGEYQLSLIELDANSLENKLRNEGITLTNGDVYSYLVFITGTFDATVNGQPTKGVIPPITFSQTFSYQEYGGIICDNDTEYFDGTGCVVIPPDTCTPPEVLNPVTEVCEIVDEGAVCEPVPVCQSNENIVVTDNLDACGFNILICEPIEGGVVPPPSDTPILLPPTEGGGCPNGYSLNSFNNCQRIGSGSQCTGEGCEPKTKTTGGGLCDLDADFNFGQCFASLFDETGTGGFQITGIPTNLIIIVVLIAVIIIIIAIAIRIRRGGGYKV